MKNCSICNSDYKKAFKSEIHTLRSQKNQISQDTRSTQNTFGNGVEVIVKKHTLN